MPREEDSMRASSAEMSSMRKIEERMHHVSVLERDDIASLTSSRPITGQPLVDVSPSVTTPTTVRDVSPTTALVPVSRNGPFSEVEVTDGPPQKRRRSTEYAPSTQPPSLPVATDYMNAHQDDRVPRMPPYALYNEPAATNPTGIKSQLHPSKLDRDTDAPLPSAQDARMRDADPYRHKPQESLYLLDLFFTHQMPSNHFLFPRSNFMRWVQDAPSKSPDEVMVTYSMLTLGSCFADGFSPFARECAERADRAVSGQFGRSSLCLIQCRLILAMFHKLQGREDVACDHFGLALRALGTERLNSEQGCAVDRTQPQSLCFDLSAEQMSECKRRTFWTAFLLDVSTSVN